MCLTAGSSKGDVYTVSYKQGRAADRPAGTSALISALPPALSKDE